MGIDQFLDYYKGGEILMKYYNAILESYIIDEPAND